MREVIITLGNNMSTNFWNEEVCCRHNVIKMSEERFLFVHFNQSLFLFLTKMPSERIIFSFTWSFGLQPTASYPIAITFFDLLECILMHDKNIIYSLRKHSGIFILWFKPSPTRSFKPEIKIELDHSIRIYPPQTNKLF